MSEKDWGRGVTNAERDFEVVGLANEVFGLHVVLPASRPGNRTVLVCVWGFWLNASTELVRGRRGVTFNTLGEIVPMI